ncbi:MAG: helix-turn-helix domain-containing protein [Methylocystis sp.]
MARHPAKLIDNENSITFRLFLNNQDRIDSARQDADLPAWVTRRGRSLSIDRSLGLKNESRLNCQQTCSNGLSEKGETPLQLLKISQAAWRLNVSEKSVRRLIEAGKLPVLRIGRSIRIHPQVIENMIFLTSKLCS